MLATQLGFSAGGRSSVSVLMVTKDYPLLDSPASCLVDAHDAPKALWSVWLQLLCGVLGVVVAGIFLVRRRGERR